MSQLEDLARPLPNNFVHTNPSGGGSYVAHHVIVQALLSKLGPFDFELVKILKGWVPAIVANPNGSSRRAKEGAPPLPDAIVGAICRLTVTIDGRLTRVEEVGDCESPHNWPHDGARMKDAMSDALKRCAMRLGLGLHLWSQDEYRLDRLLAAKNPPVATPLAAVEGVGSGETQPPTPPKTLVEKVEQLIAKQTEVVEHSGALL